MTTYREEFEKGEQRAKIRSRKQVIVSRSLQGLVIALALFNDFPIFIKILIFAILQLILGAVMSSEWMERRFQKWARKPASEQTKFP
jgi:hypothetical protein